MTKTQSMVIRFNWNHNKSQTKLNSEINALMTRSKTKRKLRNRPFQVFTSSFQTGRGSFPPQQLYCQRIARRRQKCSRTNFWPMFFLRFSFRKLRMLPRSGWSWKWSPFVKMIHVLFLTPSIGERQLFRKLREWSPKGEE